MKWIEKYRVNSHDCDENGKVRPSLILRYMQETANLQLRALGPTREQLLAENRAFILSRLNMSIYGDLHAYEDIEVRSWACESRGATFNRCYYIRRNGELIAEAASVWGLIGIGERKIYRVEDVTLGFETDELARKISNIIGTDEDGNYTGTLAPVADIPIVGMAISLFAEFGSTAGQVTPPTVS